MTESRFTDRVAVVTGGASGIGRAVVARLAAEGAHVVAVDVNEARAVALRDELGDTVTVRIADVTREDEYGAVITETAKTHGRLDAVINNAGIEGPLGSIADISAQDWALTHDVVLGGVFVGSKFAAKVMKEQRSGVILNVASAAGVAPGLGPHAYTSAKHAVVGLTKSIAVELAPFGIRVNAVAPGRVITPLTAERVGGDLESAIALEESRSPFGRAPLPEDLADVITYLVSDGSWYVNGECITVDGTKGVLQTLGRGVFYPDGTAS